MNGRRDFLKKAFAAGGAVALAGTSRLEAKAPILPGIIYTQSAPGRWKGKEGAHVPKVSVEGGTVKVVNAHPVTAAHYIVKHTLLTPEGTVLGESVFTSSDTPESTHTLPAGFKGAIWVTSFCNIHDLWLVEVSV
jgi:superoxide reductase